MTIYYDFLQRGIRQLLQHFPPSFIGNTADGRLGQCSGWNGWPTGEQSLTVPPTSTHSQRSSSEATLSLAEFSQQAQPSALLKSIYVSSRSTFSVWFQRKAVACCSLHRESNCGRKTTTSSEHWIASLECEVTWLHGRWRRHRMFISFRYLRLSRENSGGTINDLRLYHSSHRLPLQRIVLPLTYFP